MAYTHFDKVSGRTGLGVGAKGSEILCLDSAGKLNQPSGNTATTVGAAGAASALPAAPLGYLQIVVNGTTVKVPYYNN